MLPLESFKQNVKSDMYPQPVLASLLNACHDRDTASKPMSAKGPRNNHEGGQVQMSGRYKMV